VKALLLGDVHATSHAPSSCTESYEDDLFDLIQQAAREWSPHCDVAVVAGDVFHHKAPSRTPHKLVLRMIEALREFDCDVLVVPGNHDIQHDRLDSLFVSQPLGVVLQSGAAHLLAGWGSPFPLFGVPWQQHWTDEAVRSVLEPYREMRQQAPDQPYLVVTHAPLYPPGQELPYENYPAAQFADAMGGRGQVFYGHVHEPHGAYEVGGVTFCNNGALSRGSLHEYNLERQVGITVWDSGTGGFDFVPLHARPASEVFRLEEKQQVTDMQGRLDEFLGQIAQTQLGVLSIETVSAHLQTLDLGPDLALARELLEFAHGGGT
jgi:DNA repair exonuclease SbcCD nuclease subunit